MLRGGVLGWCWCVSNGRGMSGMSGVSGVTGVTGVGCVTGVRYVRCVRRRCRTSCAKRGGRCGWLPLGVRRFDLTHQLVGFLLRHLAATNHVLQEITRALDDEAGKSGSGADHVLHRCGHLASRLEADLMRLGRHFGDRIFYVGSTVPRAALRWDRRRRHGCANGWGRCCSSSSCGLFFIYHLWAPVSEQGVVLTDLNITEVGSSPEMGSNGAKYMIFRD